ncbi:flavin reductase family protein [Candidatus Bipolaricaulota bacterium]|nr:flavin reductase family protein [Candidatus Bipolaricaulota bacterium]
MRERIGPWDEFARVQEQLSGAGALLVSVDARGRPNAMTIGWGQIGTVWSRPIFLVLVRPSRYTHGCIEHTSAFTVNVPVGTMAAELEFCGSRSGRETDKFAVLGLETEPGHEVPVPMLAGCTVVYECRVVAKTALVPQGLLDDGVRSRYYPRGDLHSLFFGEILATWRNR